MGPFVLALEFSEVRGTTFVGKQERRVGWSVEGWAVWGHWKHFIPLGHPKPVLASPHLCPTAQ